jgi:transcriptional regulator with XRE-family HTH domain
MEIAGDRTWPPVHHGSGRNPGNAESFGRIGVGQGIPVAPIAHGNELQVDALYLFRYNARMTTVRNLRSLTEVTQSELAHAAGTSQPTIAAYETGSKSPTLSTVERLAASVGKEAVVVFVTPLTRQDNRSLAIHRAIAIELRHDPTAVLKVARTNLRQLTEQHPHATQLLNDWVNILNRPVESIIEAMLDPSEHARELRHVTPFAGVLSSSERASVYRHFAKQEHRS